MPFIYKVPDSVSFRGKGLFGYSFGQMNQKDIEVLYVESETGHDTFMICHGVTRTYYILAGSGSFTIQGRVYSVHPGFLVEVPSGVEYSYSGRMTILVFCRRRWFRRKDEFTRWNRDVIGDQEPWSLKRDSGLTRLVRLRIFGKSPTNAFLRANQRFWKMLPSSVKSGSLFDWYGRFLHGIARRQDIRAQAFNTFFLRNRPELEMIRRVASSKSRGATLRVAVLACSTGAEVYSIAWTIKKARPDLKLIMHAVDVSSDAVEFARRGVYPLDAKMDLTDIRDCMAAGRWRVGGPDSQLIGSEIFERMTDAEKSEFFEFANNSAVVKDWIKQGINWAVADVREPELLERIGPQDIVVASNFLCHMQESEAERCLRNIAQSIDSQGYLFVSGVDLDIRQKVAKDLRWEPVTDLLKEIHEGDSCLTGLWPCQYAGLEPLNTRRKDWKIRYAAAFRIDHSADSGQSSLHYETAQASPRVPNPTI